MGRWNDMKEPESLEDYVARLAQEEESQSKILLAQAGPLGPAQLFAAEAPRPTPRPSPPADSWVRCRSIRKPGKPVRDTILMAPIRAIVAERMPTRSGASPAPCE